jgi:hypothetical protein
MIEEEISIDGKTIMPKEETKLTIMSIKMRTTKRTIVGTLTPYNNNNNQNHNQNNNYHR